MKIDRDTERCRPSPDYKDRSQPYQRWVKWMFPVIGLGAFVWFLIRVIPKPSRATYPCQRAAFPLASGFIVWLVGLTVATLAFRKAKHLLRKSRYVVAGLCIAVAVASVWFSMSLNGEPAFGIFTPSDGTNNPIGTPKGIYPGRVVWAHDPDATSWDGVTGMWVDEQNTDQNAVDLMISNSLHTLTGQNTDPQAWDALFRHYNQNKGKGNIGYLTGEKIVIKINMNNYGYLDGRIDASPHMVLGLLRQMINQAAIPPSTITIYDGTRTGFEQIIAKCHAEFPAVIFLQNPQVQWVPESFVYSAETISDAAQNLPQTVLDAEYMINLAILKKHNVNTAVTLCAKNHFGTIASPGSLHEFVRCFTRGMGSYDPQVDLMGCENIGGKTLLYIIDGLYGASTYSAIPTKWTLEPFNNDWPSSILISQDPVAIDSVGLDFLNAEWSLLDHADNYLHEAAQAHNPPSNTFYDPENDGIRMPSLGVHEHWNNAQDKQYSRNLGSANGIELISWLEKIVIADLNNDSKVDYLDFSLIALHWQQNFPDADLNNDQIVDAADLKILTDHWLLNSEDGNLVGFWKLDEKTGAYAYDFSASGNNGTLINNPTWTLGKTNGALSFLESNDALEVGTDNFNHLAGAVSLWVYPEYYSSANQYLFSHATAANTNLIQLYISNTSGQLNLGLGDSTTRHANIINLNSNAWSHIVLTWNGTNYQVFVNGNPAASGSYTGLTTFNPTAYIGNIGAPLAQNQTFNGRIDDVRIYNKTLVLSTVQQLYNLAPPFIYQVQSSNTPLTHITWLTDEPATSCVEYGPNLNYNSITNLDTNLVNSHMVPLSDLIPDITYHYRVRSIDAQNNQAFSPDYTFMSGSQLTNLPPVANPGPDQTVYDYDEDGKEIVVLDGVESLDPDGFIINYSWYLDGNLICSESECEVELLVGVHRISLRVMDNKFTTNTDFVMISVEQPPLDVHQ